MRLRLLLLFVALLGCAPFAQRMGASTDLDTLHPDFRGRVTAVIADLERRGHPVRVVTTWRDPRRQELVYLVGRLGSRLGRGPGTLVRGGQSCHNQLDNGVAASAAVDLRPADARDHAEKVAFYKAVGRAAKARGLRWGGDWEKRDPLWAKDGLGWDPGHVEDARLCRTLRKR